MAVPTPDGTKAPGALVEPAGPEPGATVTGAPTSGPTSPAGRDDGTRRPIASRPGSASSPEEAEAAYLAARDAWTAAMRASSSGRPADLAALAIAQEAYEAAAAERRRWAAAPEVVRVAVPVEPVDARRGIEVVVGQELEWRRVKDRRPSAGGLLSRIKRIFSGDG